MSLSWSIEMWGYGILGIGSWLMYGYYTKKNRFINWLLLGNAIMSIAAVLLTIADIKWVLTTAGIIAYMLWNALMIVLMTVIYKTNKVTA